MRVPGVFLVCGLLLAGIGARGQQSDQDAPGKTENPWSWGVESDFGSKYLWKGISYNEGLVIQPSLWATRGNFTAGLWGNYAAYDRFHSEKVNEVDLVFTYAYSIGKFEIDHTIMFYYYPGVEDAPPTGEFFLGVGYPIGEFSLFSSATADFLTYPGNLYFEHGVEFEKDLNEKLLLEAKLSMGWANGRFNETYIGTTKTSVNLIGADISLMYTPRGAVYLKPHLQVNRTADQDLLPYLGKYPWFCGLAIGIEL